MADPTSQNSTPPTTPTSSTQDVQRTGGEAGLQKEFQQVDQQVGQPIHDQPIEGKNPDEKRRGLFIDLHEDEDGDPTTTERDLRPPVNSTSSTPATTSTTASDMTTPTASVTPTKPTSE